jgi:hypothetical protein
LTYLRMEDGVVAETTAFPLARITHALGIPAAL